jgi:ribonuclease D
MLSIEHASCAWVASTEAMEEAAVVLRGAEVIAVDVEGKDLGHGGRAATIQLATPDTCYVVDLVALGMPGNLREVLQGKVPVKVCHGFTNDQINLIEQFNLDFSEATLFDTQEALTCMSHSGGKSVVDVLEGFTAASPTVLSEMRAMKEQLRWVDFLQRPLPENVVRYSCLDVVFLGSAYTAMTQQLSQTQVANIVDKSKYRGPYGRGDCYRPPTMSQIARQEQKGKTWNEQRRQWVRMR